MSSIVLSNVNGLDIDERLKLIQRRLETIGGTAGEEIMRNVLEKTETPRCIWITAPTGKPHIGYFVPLAKFADFIRAGLEVTVLFHDQYAFLINYEYSMDLVTHRTQYYRFIITSILEALDIDTSKIRFVNENEFGYERKFVDDTHRVYALSTQQDVREVGWEVGTTRMMSPLLCPARQILAEEYLDIDIQFGGEDQRGVFHYAERFLPQLGYRKRAHIMNVMVGSLIGGKMSSSHPPNSKIEFLDDPKTVREKIEGAHYEEGKVTGNAVLLLLKDVLIPISQERVERQQRQNYSKSTKGKLPFTSQGAPKDAVFSVPCGGAEGTKTRHYRSYIEIEQDFEFGGLRAAPLKAAVAEALNGLLEPIRTKYWGSSEWQNVARLAYPKNNRILSLS